MGVRLNCDAAVAAGVGNHLGEHDQRMDRLQSIQMTEHMLSNHSPRRLSVLSGLGIALIVRFADQPKIRGRAVERARNPHCILVLTEERLFSRSVPASEQVMNVGDFKKLQNGQDNCGLGTMVMHRADRKPLLPVHVLALEEFVLEKAKLVADVQGEIQRESLVFHMTKENFSIFWERFLGERAKDGNNEAAKSPFEM
jgi:hypothetical protein